MEDKKTQIIIDGNSLLYRAFHAVPSTLTSQAGMPTNAVYGFAQSLKKIIADFSPQYIGVAFDVKGPTFRHEKFADYKANRPQMPREQAERFLPQIPVVKSLLKAMNIPVLESRSFEADDIIATIAKKAAKAGLKTAIVTGDKDMCQLVDSSTVILDYLTGRESGPAEVEEKFGVPPALIRDLLGLAGDASDGIPGVPGIGLKTAAKLLKEFGAIEEVYANVDRVRGARLKESLEKFRDQAFLSRELATLHEDVPFEWSLEGLRLGGPDYGVLIPLLKELGFSKMLGEVLKEAAPEDENKKEELVKVVDSAEGLEELLRQAGKSGRVAVVMEQFDAGLNAAPYAVAISIAAGEAFYAAPAPEDPGTLFGGDRSGIDGEAVELFLKALLEDAAITKDTDNLKPLYVYGAKRGIEVRGEGIDTSLASYLIDPSRPDHSALALAYEYLGEIGEPSKAAKGRGEGDENERRALLCRRAMAVNRLEGMLDGKLLESGLKALYLEMEMPLTKVIVGMEMTGIRVDAGILKDLSREIEAMLSRIEGEIYASAGYEFNISSPKQLSDLLFERLKLRPVKKTKTGYSTDEAVLTELARSHEIPEKILGFRQLTKLKSTYVDALLALIDARTGRIHTSFNQTVTATGRLSSSRPNLQNIPARGEYALRIREAFVPEDGFFFLSADYSQIELRIVAHLSEDPVLIDAFNSGEDVHARTAAEVFGVKDPAMVTPDMRRRAKAINFGIIYGMGAYGLSTELGIPVDEAASYIESYFRHYSMVKRFIDTTIAGAAGRGYTTTIFGRRRYVPELKSPVDSTVRFGERVAVNTPIQGSAADMIKAAMIRIDRRLKEERCRSRMLLQIHDELVFEVPEDEREAAAGLVRLEMEGVVSLRVPVKVNLKSGRNWRTVE